MRGETPGSKWSAGTWVALGLSFLLRATLAVRGGQQFWPDEDRFDISRRAANALVSGNLVEAARAVFRSSDHLLFKIIAVLPALLERLFQSGPWLPGMFFAAVSTLVIWMVGRVGRADGGNERDAFFATLAASASTSLFYYSQHFFPYDLSLCFFLAATAAAVNAAATPAKALQVGLLASGGFLCYNGYWTLVPVTSGLLLAQTKSVRSFFITLAILIAGVLLPIAVGAGIGSLLGFSPLGSYVEFSRTTVQGDYDQAWRFVGEYFWQTERLNAWVFLGAVSVVFWAMFRWKSSRAGILAVMAVVSIYGLIVVGSDVFSRFAVSARHVRAIAPFGAWIVGSALALVYERGRSGKFASLACCGLITLLAARNFAEPLAQVFPRDFPAAAREEILTRRNSGEGLQPLRILNDGYLHNPNTIQEIPAAAEVLWSQPHPFHYVPHLFEGYGEIERTEFMKKDSSMKVARFKGTEPITGFPYAFRLTCTYAPPRPAEAGGPILCSGATGAGDVVFLRYQSARTASVGLDHWGSASRSSPPFAYEWGKPHTWIVIAPCLIGDTPNDRLSRDRIVRWSRHLYVSVDGTAVLNIDAAFFPSQEASTTVGLNLIHAGSTPVSLPLVSARFSALRETDWAKADASW